MKVKTSSDKCEYITSGKKYEVIRTRHGGRGFDIIDDQDDEIYCSFKACAHLDCDDWKVVKDKS